ncbi:hypothetical protein GGR92_000009 [Spirosoma lacussanchae]
MYLHIPSPPFECSACGAVNNVDVVSREESNSSGLYQVGYVRCRSCRHERETSRVTLYQSKAVTYQLHEDLNKTRVF